MTGQGVWLLLRRTAPSLRPITRDVGVVLLLYALVAFIRIVDLIQTPLAASSGLFETPSVQVAFVLVNQLLCIVLTVTLIMMVTRRLEQDVQTQAAERVHAEQASAESQKRFALAFRTSPYGITITRASDGQMIEVNEGFANITGYSAAECIGKTSLELGLWADAQDRARVVATLAQGSPVSGMELRFRKKNGMLVTGLLSANLLMLGDQPCILSSINDITARKRMEESLLASEARYRAVAQTAHDAIITADSAGNIVGWNQGAENIFGYPEAEAIGQALTLLVPSQYGDRHLAGIQRLQVGGEPRLLGKTVELTGRRKDGSEFPVELALSEWRVAEGQFYTGIIRDITERKRAEETLRRQAAELERSNRDLAQFAYVASHDLQEPLRMVSSYVQLLAKRYQGQLDQDADEFIGFAVEGASRMQRLISELLKYSRVGMRGKDFAPTSCETVVDQALANLQMVIQESGAVVSRDPLPTLLADELQLTQVFQNLISNAIKFRGVEPPRVHISAELRNSDFGFRNAGPSSQSATRNPQWLFSVRDNGIGIAPEHRDRIFGIFQRLYSQAEYPGTGIGLATCKKIVEQHDGRIWVESQPGQGATFYFTIPA